MSNHYDTVLRDQAERLAGHLWDVLSEEQNEDNRPDVTFEPIQSSPHGAQSFWVEDEEGNSFQVVVKRNPTDNPGVSRP